MQESGAGDTKNAVEDEQTLASGQVTIDGKVYASIDDYLEGNATYEINYIEDLVAVAYSVNKGEDTYLGNTIKLMRDLDFQDDASYKDPEAKYVLESANTGYTPDETNGTSIKELLLGDNGFIPIGTRGSQGYYGTIKGNNKVIKNMKITSITSYGGLIGTTKAGTEIKISDLGLEDEDISCNSQTGGIIGIDSNGATITIDNCYTTGTITGGGYVGGILGYSGVESVTITNCYFTGTVSLYAGSSAGGILGGGSGKITGCFNAGIVQSAGCAGGILGSTNGGTISLTDCYNIGTVTGTSTTGGISGQNGTITNCYNTGIVTCTGSAPAGGISGAYGTITNCYNTGIVTSQNEALIGGISGAGGTVTNCYFMKGTASVGVGNSGTGDTTEKEEADMQTDTFLEELKGSTDNTAWKRDDSINNGMPILSWQLQ